ncbi:killer cell lectin-like receptor 2 [Heterocephalus glaber]|uniref:Killer cell lectin-like receptor 2 n=2 Tax=Heterocephalus glaber TaxID=10181 RepID=A0AAX6T0H3_HETGA|nr:killer cell lectin-like receptor 2 [Heterocephalus glaber]
MSAEEVTYTTLRFLQSPSEAQNKLRPNATKGPREDDGKGFAVPWHLIAATLGIICLLLLMTVVVLVMEIFQEKNEKEKIRENLWQAQNDSSLKERLTNKTLEYDILKNEMHQKNTELELSSKKKCHRKNKTVSKPLQNKGKICEDDLTCCGVKCYYFIKESKDWNGCKLTCQDYGLSPVKIDDRDELDFLRLQLGQCYYWIGLSFDTGENRWKWTESGASPGINVRTMLPSSWEGKCAFLSATRISNIACSKTYNCICEKRMDGTFPASVCSEEERKQRQRNRES